MNKNLIVAALLSSVAAFSFAQTPAATPAPVKPMPAPMATNPTMPVARPDVAPVGQPMPAAAASAAKHGKHVKHRATKKARKMKKADAPAA